MKTILRRLTLLIKIWLKVLLAPASDPRQDFSAAYSKQQGLLAKVRQAQGNVARSKAHLETKTGEARQRLPQLEDRARRALAAGREDSARFALQLRHMVVAELEALDKQVAEMEREEGMLVLVEQRLATQIEAFFARQEVLEARFSTAEAHVKINEALSGVSDELADLGIALERAEQTTEDMQARVTAIDQLVDIGVLEMPGRSGAGALALPEFPGNEGPEGVEEKLAELRQELGGPPSLTADAGLT